MPDSGAQKCTWRRKLGGTGGAAGASGRLAQYEGRLAPDRVDDRVTYDAKQRGVVN
jgi:hypothetical protein